MSVFVFLLIIIIILFVIAKFVSNKDKPQQQSQQPIHFDLLDDTGEPLPKEPVVKNLQYFCTKDSGYYVSIWPKDQKIPDYLEFEIAGMSYPGNLDDYTGEHVGTLEPEPDNPYDANAIKILAEDGHHVGYVPKDMTEAVREFTSIPCTCYFYIGSNDGTYYSDAYISNVSPNKFSNTPNLQ